MKLRIPIGSHLVSPRRGYTHHGIYLGRGRVVHYSGKSDGLNSGPVEIAKIERFACGKSFKIKTHALPKYRGREVAARARLRVGENLYSLVANNCEHFCEWCIHDKHRSLQVKQAGKMVNSTLATAGVARTALPTMAHMLAAAKVPYPPLLAAGALLSLGLLAYTMLSANDGEV